MPIKNAAPHDSNESAIPFEEFRHLVAEQLQVPEETVLPEASFLDDLLADSIQLVNMMLSLEERGVTIPMEAAWDVRTVDDAYRVYLKHATNR